MKRKIFCLMAVMAMLAMSMVLLTGCGSTSQKEDTTDPKKQEIANPWTESDEQGVAEATGFDMATPDGATDVSYSYMTEGALAQMCYELDGAHWVYRMQKTDALTDISGMEYQWTMEEEGNVSWMAANYYGYVSEGGTEDSVQLVNWYDALTGVTYSLSASGEDLDGMDIQMIAENLYVSLQDEATDDPDADRESELNNYFLGEHTRSYDESTLTISENEDGTFDIALRITRLCNLEQGVGTFENHKMTFTVLDPSENEMSGVIYLDSDNSLTVQITDSTWELLPNDEIFEGFGK